MDTTTQVDSFWRLTSHPRDVGYKMIDNKELAEYLYNEISEHQGDEDVKRTRPMTWPTGLYFNSNDLEYWIEQFKCKDFVGHSEWSEEYQKNIWIKDND
jgi:hypothetical protein